MSLLDINFIFLSVFNVKRDVFETFVDFDHFVFDVLAQLRDFGFHLFDFGKLLMELFFEVISGFLNTGEGKVGKVVIFVG